MPRYASSRKCLSVVILGLGASNTLIIPYGKATFAP
jgi:hypothetical protein